jgi:hypothetical protein
MMKKVFIVLAVSFLASCSYKSQISKDLDCTPEAYSNLEIIKDYKEKFSVQFPDNWKTNLYYDNNQSSIYSADTTKQLTETFLVDITQVSTKLELDSEFIQKFKTNLLNNQLIESTSYETMFQGKETYFSRALGKKNNYDYQICNLFIKTSENNYIHAKAEVYGDSLVNERICNAMSLIEKTEY